MNEHLRILLVEDNLADAELIEELIKDTGVSYDLTWLKDGQKAIDFFVSGGATDLILLDLNIPKASGHEVLSFLRERDIPSSIPVIILTGSTYPKDMERSKEKGVVHYLIKPMTIEEMEQVTRTLREILLGRYSRNR
jgi:CheY-like chemotaxis protein